jgi:hypothetical protein
MFKFSILYFNVLIVIIISIGSSMIYTHAADSANDNNINNNTILKNGRISSIVLDLPQWGTFDVKNISKFLLSGDWNISISNERPINFIANFSMVSVKCENLHNHQFINFEIKNETSRNIQILSDMNVTFSGTMDITTNGEIKWNQIRTNISLYNDNTIIIDFDPNQFIGQPVYGTVE